MRRGRPGADGASIDHGTRNCAPAGSLIRRRPLSCASARDQIEAFHDGSLDLERTRLMAAHLATCVSCAARLAEVAAVDRLLGTATLPPAPAALRERLYARIATTPTPDQNTVSASADAPRRPAVTVARPRRLRLAVLTGAVSMIAAATLTLIVVAALPQERPVIARHVVAPNSIADTPALLRLPDSEHVSSLDALPHFTDWRAAYVGFDHQLHVVTPDGMLDIAAPLPLAVVSSWTGAVTSRVVSVSPDGRAVASISRASPSVGGPVALLSLTTGKVMTIPVAARALYWSLGGDRLAVNVGDERTPRVALIQPSDGTVTSLTGRADGVSVTILAILGWIDASHLAVVYSRPAVMGPPRIVTPTAAADSASRTNALGALDADSGNLQLITTIPGSSSAYLTPNGTETLVTPSALSPAEIIDTATGATRALPGITRRLAGVMPQPLAISSAQANALSPTGVWQPASGALAISLAAPPASAADASHATQPASTLWLLDADHDIATPLGANRTPLAWTPDGRTLLLAGSPIPLSTAESMDVAQPALYALAPVAPGGTETALTGGMELFLGLVRNS